MPANQKYLETSNWQKAARLSAGMVGGYILALEIHYLLAISTNQETVFDAMRFSFYLIWVVLMFLPFLSKSGWLCWVYYGMAGLFAALLIYLYR